MKKNKSPAGTSMSGGLVSKAICAYITIQVIT